MGGFGRPVMSRRGSVADEGPPCEVDVTGIQILPNMCEVSRELNLEIDYVVDQQLHCANWSLKLIIDYAGKRKERVLADIDVGECLPDVPLQIKFEVPSVDVLGIREHILTAPSLLLASLSDGAVPIIQVSLETHCPKNFDHTFMRTVVNPLSLVEEETDEQKLIRLTVEANARKNSVKPTGMLL